MTLDFFFNPKAIAVIGASRNRQKVGNVIFRNMLERHERVFPVNPKADEIEGVKCYKSVLEIPCEIDLAVIAIPANFVPKALEECGEKGVKGVIIISGGFSEVGNIKLEEEIKKIAKKYNIRIIGPNCVGVLSDKVDSLFFPAYRLKRPEKGKIAFISQSGAYGAAMLDWLASEGLGISKFVSYGNKADVDDIDLLSYLKDDEETKVIVMYLEETGNGRKFMEIAKQVSLKKPIIVLKAGQSEEGAKAVASHTGSMAGKDEIYSAAFKQCGIIRAYDSEELFDFAKALLMQPPISDNRVAIVTDGGGFGIIATDICVASGLRIAKLSKETIEELRENLPERVSVHNPIDLTGDADSQRYEIALNIVAKDSNVDALLVILLFQVPTLHSDIVDVLTSIQKRFNKPIVVCAAGGEFTKIQARILEEAGIPVYPTPGRAAKAIKALYDYGKWLRKNKKSVMEK